MPGDFLAHSLVICTEREDVIHIEGMFQIFVSGVQRHCNTDSITRTLVFDTLRILKMLSLMQFASRTAPRRVDLHYLMDIRYLSYLLLLFL